MRPIHIASFIGLSIASVIACSGSGGDDGASGAADLSATADAGAPLTPVQAVEQKLVGAWSAHGADGTSAIVITPGFNTGVVWKRFTPAKTPPKGVNPSDALDQATLIGGVLTVDGKGGGTLKVSEFIFESGSSKNKNELYTFAFGTAGGTDTLTLTETSENFTKPLPFGSDAGPTLIDGGPITLELPITFTRVPSFCSGSDEFDMCFEEFSRQILTLAIPDACKGREDLCFTCGSDNRCAVKVPSSCELARFVCVESIEKCEFSDDPNTDTVGQATTVDGEGNAVDCGGAPAGHSVCCEVFGRNSRAG